jgi:hypothetical protein
MPTDDHPGLPSNSRRLRAGVVVVLISVALLVAVLLVRDGGGNARTLPTPTPSSSETARSSTTLDPRSEIISRLREILKVRDKAFQDRNAALLEEVYTVDCPCLKGDRSAIQELKAEDYRIVGGATSIQVRRVERVNARLWLVVADFRSAPLRIETEEKRLIREEAGGSDLFQFALSKPTDSSEWLLGRAISYRDG